LADVATGAAAPDDGRVLIDGGEIGADDPRAFRRAGVCCVPADPLREFVVPGLTVGEHAALWESAGAGRMRFDRSKAVRKLRDDAERCGLAVAAPDRRLDQLSGGNIQRVLLALALGADSRALVVSFPTRGLDVLTTETTRGLLLAAREHGRAVLLISEDLDELMALSDRIAVLAHGRVAGVVDAATTDRQTLGALMTGSGH
jgi:simple sugar transport system ATP-binding protein